MRRASARASGQLGKNLSIHPACGALAEFDEQIMPWKGIPQGYSIEELHEEGILFEGAMVPLEMTMSMTQLIGPELIRLAESFDHVASFGFMVEDTSRGSVREVMGQPVIQYWLQDKDVAHIKRGLDVLAQVFFAAGAQARAHADRRASTCSSPGRPRRRCAARRSAPWDLDLSAYHPLGTARMGTRSGELGGRPEPPDARLAPASTSSTARRCPSALGVNPQITIMALATRAAEKIAARLS